MTSSRRAPQGPSSQVAALSAAVGLVTLCVLPLALGGLWPQVVATAGGAFAVSAALGSRSLASASWNRSTRLVGASLVAATVWTAVSLLPLPEGLLRFVSPVGHDVWLSARALAASTAVSASGAARAAASSAEWPGLITVDPPATRLALGHCALYVVAYLACLHIARMPRGRTLLPLACVASASLFAFACLVHSLAAMPLYLGVVPMADPTMTDAAAIAPGPLLNPNHRAAVVNVGFAVALGLACARRPPFAAERRVWWTRGAFAVVAASLATTSLWFGSRGGTAGALVAAAVVAAATFGRQRERDRRWSLHALLTDRAWRFGLPSVLVGAAVVLFALGVFDQTGKELTDTNTSKLGVAWDALRLVGQSPLTGVGRGAFEPAFAAVRSPLDPLTYRTPENWMVQLSAEWGLPFVAATAATLAVALSPRVLRRAGSRAVGPYAALVGAMVHQAADDATDVPAYVVLLVACAAQVVGFAENGLSSSFERVSAASPPARASGRGAAEAVSEPSLPVPSSGASLVSSGSSKRARSIAAPALLLAAACGALLCVYFPLSVRGTLLADERRVVRALADVPSFDELAGAATRVASRHPADGELFSLLALRLTATAAVDGERSIARAWAEAAVQRGPMLAPAHIALARASVGHSKQQVLESYGRALARTVVQQGALVREVAPHIASVEDARIVLALAQTPTLAPALAKAIEGRLPEAAHAILPPRERARAALTALLSAWATAEPSDREPLGPALKTAALSFQPHARGCGDGALVARGLALAGDGAAAMKAFELPPSGSDPFPCHEGRFRTATDLALAHEARAALDAMEQTACTAQASCGPRLIAVATAHQARGDWPKAIEVLRRARERAPSDPNVQRELQRAMTALQRPRDVAKR